jgi:dienelactone hydrolase
VLPLHGPRRTGWISGDGYFSGDCLDTVHAQAQAVWDVRRLLAWLRARGADEIGIYGLSLGGYTAALLAALEPGLRCVIAGIPATDFVHLAQLHTPPALVNAAVRAGFDWDRVERVFRVVAPLAMPVRVARRRRHVFAGIADRIVPISQARRLWQHWERPNAFWYRGSHLSFTWEPRLQSWLFDALRTAFACAAPRKVAA